MVEFFDLAMHRAGINQKDYRGDERTPANDEIVGLLTEVLALSFILRDVNISPNPAAQHCHRKEGIGYDQASLGFGVLFPLEQFFGGIA